MLNDTDEYGFPTQRIMRTKRIQDKGADELIGVCKGLLADNRVNQDEAEFLLKWLETNQHLCNTWPASILTARLYEYLRDGRLDALEQQELFDLLAKTTGFSPDQDPTLTTPATLFFDQPPPVVAFENRNFCLTGRFAFGSRGDCEEEIRNLGGWVHGKIQAETHYLVVGTLASPAWAHSTHGRKIENALSARDRGQPIAIVTEDRWAEYLVVV